MSLQANVAVSGTVYAVQNGQLTVNPPPAPYVASLLSNPAHIDTASPQLRMPSRLLAAKNQVVPFYPRPGTTEALTAWLDDSSQPGLSLRLVHGPGGQGKTRLALDLAARVRSAADRPWTTIEMRHETDRTVAGVRSAPVTVAGAGGLFLIDYAERWPTSDLLACVRRLAADATTPTRVLMLARDAGLWWRSTRWNLSNDGIVDIADIRLPELASSHEDRLAIYLAARRRFAELFRLPTTAELDTPDLGDDRYSRALDLHLRALTDVDQASKATGPLPDTDGAELTAYLLDREAEYWSLANLAGGNVRAHPRLMRRVVLLATVAGPVHADQANSLIRQTSLADTDAAALDLIDDHSVLYPPEHPDAVFEPLAPDRLAEDFIGAAASSPGQEAGMVTGSDPWARDTLRDLLRFAPGSAPTYLPSTVTVLVEAARRWSSVAELLSVVLTERPDVAIEAGGAALMRLTEVPGIATEALIAIEALLPVDHHLDWDVAAAALVEDIATQQRRTSTDQRGIAKTLTQLALRLGNAGRGDEAPAPAREAVALLRELEGLGIVQDLAYALHILANRLLEAGDQPGALAAVNEAISYRRTLAEDDERLLLDLAASLNNLGVVLARGEDFAGAVAPSREALELRRRVARNEPSMEATARVAASLNNLGNRLARIGDRKGALGAAEEAVEIREELAVSDPKLHLHDLASSLTNLSSRLLEDGQLASAVAAARRSVEVFTQLPTDNPDTIAPDVASAFFNLGEALLAADEPRDASKAYDEAARIRLQLTRQQPSVYASHAGRAMVAFAKASNASGRLDLARTAIDQAIETLNDVISGGRPANAVDALERALEVRAELEAE